MQKDSASPNHMSLIEFMETFGSDEQCEDHFFKRRFKSGFVCPKCGSTSGCRISTRRMLMQCNSCKHQLSATAGTVLHDTKLPMSKWYLAAFLILSSKRGISAKELQRQIHVTYKTAWYINRRLREAMSKANGQLQLSGTVTMDESYFSGRESEENTGGKPKKRGRGTDKSKVVVAVSVDEKGRPLFAKMKLVGNFRAATIAEFAQANVEKSSTIVTDGFRAYKGQTLTHDYFHEFENFDKSDDKSALKWLHIVISNAKAFINGTYHGVKRKGLQGCLDEFCYRFNRRKKTRGGLNELIVSIIETQPVYYYRMT